MVVILSQWMMLPTPILFITTTKVCDISNTCSQPDPTIVAGITGMFIKLYTCYIGIVNGHGMQNPVACINHKPVLDNTQAALSPDYDEIKDENYAEKSSEKLHLEDASVELTKSSTNYFTLMPQEAQTESITNVNLVRCYF